ncbi:MAG TPA: hypothetical protein VF972_01510, partial [Actinomycetota bacterium]
MGADRLRRAGRSLAAVVVLSSALAVAGTGGSAAASGPRVLRVGTYQGVRGQFSTIQAAVNAARPGDWILIGPGDYHERGVAKPERAGVLIQTAGLHVRGMDRNHVLIDGTLPGPGGPCSSDPKRQSKGPRVPGADAGWNGLEVFEASGVSLENLTVCNFLTSPDGEEGNGIWWNGGDGTGQIHLHAFRGAYLTATSTYSNGFEHPRGEYGIFTS